MRSVAVSSLLGLALLFCLLSGPQAAEAGKNPIIVPVQGVTAFDSETLKPRWKAPLGETVQIPVSTAEMVIVSNGSGVTAIESESGTIRWRLNDGSAMFSAVADGEVAYLASESGSLQAVDLHTGHGIWRSHFAGWVYPPAVANHQIYTGGSAGKLWALDRSNGETLWERDLGQEMVFSPVVMPGGGIVVTTFARQVFAFSPTGSRLWQLELPAVVTSPVVLNDRLVFNGLDESLYAIDNQTGELLWTRKLAERLQTPLVVDRGDVIALLENGELISVNSRSGETREIHRVSGESITPPYLRGDRIILFLRSYQGLEVIDIHRRNGEKTIKEI